MSIDKKRVPPVSELQLLLTGADLQEALQELENAQNGDACHDKVAELLHCELKDLPKEIPERLEPKWLRELMFTILAHRNFNGV
jgi:hypothetical protein